MPKHMICVLFILIGVIHARHVFGSVPIELIPWGERLILRP